MKTEIWLPILTLGLGWALAQVTEVFRDRRTAARERLARRAELQRPTLLELQEALWELSKWADEVWWIALTPELEDATKRWHMAEEPSHHLREARARVKLLVSRVEDEQIRKLASEVLRATTSVSSNESQADDKMIALEHVYSRATAQIGEALGERY